MIPYHRFLLASMLLPISQERRLKLLKGYNCIGVSMDMIQELADSMSMVEGIDEEFRKHLKLIKVNKLNPEYSFTNSMDFAIKQGVAGIIKGMMDPTGSLLERQAIQLLSKRQNYRLMAPLVLAEQPPQEIANVFSSRFGKVVPVGVIQLSYFIFFQFGSMEEEEVEAWIDAHKSTKERYGLRLALTDHPYRVKDYLGVEAGIDLQYVASRIMSRSFSKFEDLSSVNHFEAANQAMQWGKLALNAGKEHEKVKGGEFSDFLSLFQISLREADLNIVRSSGKDISEHKAE